MQTFGDLTIADFGFIILLLLKPLVQLLYLILVSLLFTYVHISKYGSRYIGYFKSYSSLFFLYLAHHRGIMRSCYHQECDSVSNPKLKMKQGIEFLSLTAQALVLLVANMSGGGFMNLSSSKFVFCVSYEIRNREREFALVN